MKPDDIQNLLMRPQYIPVNYSFIKSLGCITSVYLSLLLSNFKYFVDKKFIKITDKFFIEEYFVYKNYGISFETQQKADKKLIDKT